MRVKKLKRTRRNIQYYRVHYNFHEPYKILLDGNFIYSMQKLKLGDVAEAMTKLLGTKRCRIFVPYCVITELRKMQKKCITSLKSQRKKNRKEKEGVNTRKRKRDSNEDEDEEEEEETLENTESRDIDVVQQSQDLDSLKEDLKVYKACIDEIKKLPKHKCGHEEKNICPTDCIPQQLGSDNPSLWWVATQDENLQNKVQQMKGVPLIACGINGIRLEPPHGDCRTQVDDQLQKSMDVAEWEKNTEVLKDHFQGQSRGKSKGWRRNKAKGPNPLSVKKKKVKAMLQQSGDTEEQNQPKKKRPRRKKQASIVSEES